MSYLLEGLRQDIKICSENLRKFYDEYKAVNQIFETDTDRYEDILLNYGTQELKFTLGFLTNIYKNIESKKYHVIDPIFDAVELSGNFELSVFFGNRILEKFSLNDPDELLIRIYTLRRILNAVLIIDDHLSYIKYLISFVDNLGEFISRYPNLIKENIKNGIDLYQFMYIYFYKIQGNEEEALGYLLKGYNLKKFGIEEGMLPYPEENNIFQIINIVGSYLQIDESFITLILDIEEYIKEFVKQIKDLKEYSYKKPSVLSFYTQNPFKKYINQFLTNIYILGFDREYREVANIFPEVISKDHSLIVRINEILLKENSKEEKLSQIKKEIDVAFNNFSKEKKENVLYVYYNACVSIYRDDKTKLREILEEIKNVKNRLKDSYSLNVPVFRILNLLGEKEKAQKLAQETKQKAVISGKKFLANAVDDYIELEF